MLGILTSLSDDYFHEYLDGISKVYDLEALPAESPLTVPFFRTLLALVPKIEEAIAIQVLGRHCGTIFRNLPPFVAPHFLDKILRSTARVAGIEQKSPQLLSLAIVACALCPASRIGVYEIALWAELISSKVDGLVFKPASDGASSWVFTIDIGEPVLISVQQIDDRADTGLAAMFIAFFLKLFEGRIREEIFSGMIPVRRELSIAICNYDEIPRDLQPYVEDHIAEKVCAVSRPTDIKDDSVPTMVWCRADIGDDWGVGSGKGGSMQTLLGYVMLEVAYSLLHGEVELETLSPKIVSVVRHTIS